MSNLDLEFEIQHAREWAKRLVTGREFDDETEAIDARLDDLEQWVKKLRIEVERLKKT